MSGGGGRRGGGHEEEHENHERWLVSYADMITVLMALFIVLFAISQVDAQKFNMLAKGLADGFGVSSSVPIQGGTGFLPSESLADIPSDISNAARPQPVDLSGSGKEGSDSEGRDQSAAINAAAIAEYQRLREIEAEMAAGLGEEGLADKVQFRINERGLVAAIVSDDIVFESASAELKPAGRDIIEALAPVLVQIPDAIVAEGHANHLPLQDTSLYRSNLHLSSARASSVMLYLWDISDIDETRTSAAGFGSSRPLHPIDDPRAIEGNRRVDLVILSPKTASVRHLLPQLDEVQRGAETGETAGSDSNPVETGTGHAETSSDTSHADTGAADAGHADASADEHAATEADHAETTGAEHP